MEHAYPTSLKGWTVIVLKRHCENMHELSEAEFLELGRIQKRLVAALREVFHSEREYIFCFAEAEGFKHIHFHVVPKHKDFNDDYKGAKVFHYLKAPPEEIIPPGEIVPLCKTLKSAMTP